MDLQPLWDWFRVLHATSGIKLTIFYDSFDRWGVHVYRFSPTEH